MKFNWEEEDEIFTLKWSVPFTSDKSTVTFIAYTFPFSFTEMTEKLDEIEESASTWKNIYCHRETLCYSLEGRRMEMVTLSA